MEEQPKRRIIFFGDNYWDFYNKQTQKVKERINWALDLLRLLDILPEQYFKHIESTSLYEIRINSGNNIFRVFCFFDKGKLVIVLNGFQKKTQKTPSKEIKKALKLQQQYYDEKEN